MDLFTRQVPFYVGHGGVFDEMVLREDLHLDPPLSQSGVHGLLHFGSLLDWCGMSVLPRRVEFGRLACSCYINAALIKSAVLQPAETTKGDGGSIALRGGHELKLMTTLLKWSLELVARQPLRIFNPPLLCLSHPA